MKPSLFFGIVLISLAAILIGGLSRQYLVENRKMVICYNAGTFNDCKLIDRDKHYREDRWDSFWFGCMSGLYMVEGSSTTNKRERCDKQTNRVMDQFKKERE